MARVRIVGRAFTLGLFWGAGVGAVVGAGAIAIVLTVSLIGLPLVPLGVITGLVVGGVWGGAVGAVAGPAGGVMLAAFATTFRRRPNLARVVTAPVVGLTAYVAAPWPIELVSGRRPDDPALAVAWTAIAVLTLAAWLLYAPDALAAPHLPSAPQPLADLRASAEAGIPADPRPEADLRATADPPHHVTVVPRLPADPRPATDLHAPNGTAAGGRPARHG